MNTPEKPTCRQIFDEELGCHIFEKVESGWRHGVTVTRVYRRESDSTFWEVNYRNSTDGETNELRDGEASIIQVEPFEEHIVSYRAIKQPTP